MATGLLVLLVGEATKFSQWVLSGDKSYQAGIKFGLTTDSWDITGKTEQEFSVDFTQDQLHAEISKLSGPVELPVPMYSAIKKNGKKLYEYARKGEEIEEVRRPMNFKTVT
jgi:tRNA pseudouridine55 synthase